MNDLNQRFISQLPGVLSEGDYRMQLAAFREKAGLSKGEWLSLRKIISEAIRTIQVESLKTGLKKDLVTKFTKDDLTAYEVAHGLNGKSYFSNITAHYYWGLTNEVPKTIYAAVEIPRQKDQSRKSHASLLTDFTIRNAFLKPARSTSNQWKFENFRVVILERMDSKEAGVIPVKTAGRLPLPAESRVTSLERTLIDSVINPQYSGGMFQVVEIFRAAKKQIDIYSLMKIYKAMSPIYPFWQTIGFILELISATTLAKKWHQHFKQKYLFFFDREAKSEWALNEHWKIYYPPELL